MPSSHRILVVDDNAVTRYSVRRVLEHHQFVVEEAGTGGEGLVRLAAEAFAAVVLDVNLPDISGFDIVRTLRAEPRTALLPVVHVSAASIATGDMITGLDAGADAYLIHPVDPNVLVATLRTLLRARNAEEALRLSEARFREIFEHIGAPIAVVDAQLHTQEANAAFQRLIGSATPCEAINVPGLDQCATVQALTAALGRRERWSGTLSILRDGAVRETEWRVSPYREPDLGLLFVEDVTEQRLREREQRQELDTATSELAHQIAERQRTEIQLLQAQKMEALGKLTGGIAHDFNNLLTSIISGLDMIQLAVESNRIERVPRLAEIATGSAHRAAALTQRMLAFARKQSLDAQPFDVNARVRSLEDMLRRSIGENIALELQLAEAPLVAIADANQLENVVLNLVINARDALQGHGTIRIQSAPHTAYNDPELEDGDYVAVNVIDDGSGIDPAILSQVFEPFFTTKPIGEGTGLGLSMTYGFARQSGGTARITSTLGSGTTVALLLPRGLTVGEALPPPPPNAPRGRSQRILLVDDTDVVRMMVSEVLSDAGYHVIEAENADGALAQLRADAQIDMVVSDVGLPGMNGRDMADVARDLRPGLPILFITGYAENAATRQEFLAEGMALLPKPFSLNDLLNTVSRMLG
ncbi:response regulator [Xanthomonas campestris pv. campestris]|uniref:response regulator n=1 Tax=Xanthomonas campestris TaxID=339 RepID=UPI0025A16CD8|nr:response regulator [Xanthomonas campestris]MDM7679157.1 response regulator [Xanthomonas campestris pv. campestris]MDM7699856.1 response regulator [Xanthomonas campestris pv. campestris]MDM7722606.1 response regulator [Xanthomonas campestris pv. campestris]MEB1977274.1 response regulator [Xanthomonas campestris pv. campestris]MEB2010858.1 response regulator [Xanthomonas campestris pv. campestris]